MFARVTKRSACLLGGTLFLLTACGQEAAQVPAWPEQPSPAYPAAAAATPSEAGPEPVPSRPEPASSSLAKSYAGKGAKSVLEGKATYYADSLAGHHTANGDVYDPHEFTAAHKKLPFGTIVRVVRVDNGKTTYARVNDRGPFGPADRIIDLSRAAASELGMLGAGVVRVRVEVLENPAHK